MKAAISNAVATYQAAHCQLRYATSTVRAPSTALVDQQAARIVELEGQLAASRSREHDLAGRVTRSELAIGLIATALGMAETTPPPEVLAEVIRRVK